MPEPKKSEPQFKLNYFDIIKGVLFPKMSKPPAKTTAPTPAAASTAAKPAAPAPSPSPAPAVAAKPAATPQEVQEKREKRMRTIWTIGSIASITVNVILLLVVIVLVNQVFVLKKMVGDQLLGGLYQNFILMDKAHITTNITVEDNIPINFDLQILQDTTVTLTESTPIYGAYVSVLSQPADIILPAGTKLPVKLDLTVPVQKVIPIKLNVPVDIPLENTELHKPFVGLQQVVAPYYWMLKPDWATCQDSPLRFLCFLFATPK